VFTGDRSGDFLIAALHAQGLANQPTSVHAADGLRLIDTYVAAAVRCAPPLNRPTIEERDTCAPYLRRELDLLPNLRVIVPLGQFGWEAALRVIGAPVPRPRFGHGAEAQVGRYTFVGTYHPSQQNTFTGKLTRQMLERVLGRARQIAARTAPGTI
jgi:uracil-DNA glycosylase